MAANPFVPFPKQKGYLKALVYGDPGTEKTRRSLALSTLVQGPTYVIDMEDGASDYGDLVADGGMYLRTKSTKQVMQAMEYMAGLKPNQIGLFIGDAVPTVLWQQLQAGYISKVSGNGSKSPEDVDFNVGVWGSLKRVYGDFMTRFLMLPCPSILIARAGEKVNGAGQKLPYAPDCEKSTLSIAKTVIETRQGYDSVIKDRTGTFTAGRHNGRLDFSKFLANTGTAETKIETNTEAADQDAGPQVHPSYTENEATAFRAALATIGTTVEEVTAFIESVGGRNPTLVDNDTRRNLVNRLMSDQGAQKFQQWRAANRPQTEAA
jgi:hypothetical protein